MMDELKSRNSVAVRVDDFGDLGTVTSNRHFSVREEFSGDSGQGGKILTAFLWKIPAKTVALAFSNDDARLHRLVKTADGSHACAIELPQGKYRFRFLVDGDWRVNDGDKNIVLGSNNELYHEIIVSAQTAESSLNKDIYNHEVLRALARHKECLPHRGGESIIHPNIASPRDGGKHVFRKPLGLLGTKMMQNKAEVRSAKLPQKRPDRPPAVQGTKLHKDAQAEENAHERQELARAMVQRGSNDGALALYKVALTIREENGLTLTPANAHCHAEMAMVFMKAEEYQLAEMHLRLALRVWRDAPKENFAQEPRHRFGDMCHYLAVVLDKQKNHQEAAEMYKQALKVYTQYADTVEPRRVQAAQKNMENNARKLQTSGEAPASTKENLRPPEDKATSDKTARSKRTTAS